MTKKCKLCLEKEADKKGSHIVPHFLLKRIENIDGKKGRDYEIGFQISKLNNSSHFGRSVQPERLEKTFGEITEEDISNNKHPLIVDYFFCANCEDRLAEIESLYAKSISIIETTEYKTNINTSQGILFWISVLWRMSINGKSGVKLTSSQNEVLRSISNNFLPQNGKEVDALKMSKNKVLQNVSYKIIRCHNCKEDDTKWLMFHPKFYKAFCLLIDEYILILSIDNDFSEIESVDCFGMNSILSQAKINVIGEKEVVFPFENTVYKELSLKIANTLKDEYLNDLEKYLDAVHNKLGGQGSEMPKHIKQKVLNEIVSEEKKLGRRYTPEDIVKSTYKTLKKYAP